MPLFLVGLGHGTGKHNGGHEAHYLHRTENGAAEVAKNHVNAGYDHHTHQSGAPQVFKRGHQVSYNRLPLIHQSPPQLNPGEAKAVPRITP
jgi:hypothetical protein